MDEAVREALKPNWRQLQWIVVAGWIIVFVVLGYMDSRAGEQRTAWGCALGFLSALAHGIWITLDFKSFGRKVGAWRFAAFFLGPLVIWLYLVVAYGRRAAWMIPLSLAIYLAPIVLVEAAMRLPALLSLPAKVLENSF